MSKLGDLARQVDRWTQPTLMRVVIALAEHPRTRSDLKQHLDTRVSGAQLKRAIDTLRSGGMVHAPTGKLEVVQLTEKGQRLYGLYVEISLLT